MKKNNLTEVQKKADKDLNIIVIATIVFVILYVLVKDGLMEFGESQDTNIWFRFFPVMFLQYGLAGLGSTIVFFYRKEKLKDYGVNKNNLIKTILLSAFVCIPAFIFMYANQEVTSYLPLQGCFFTRQFLSMGFPNNAVGYLLIMLSWGFFEGMNYVVVSKKINERYPGKNKWLNYGAIACGILCILIHGMIGFDLYSILEAVTTFIIIYGMLIIKDETDNAWGCILIFFLFWNAV